MSESVRIDRAIIGEMRRALGVSEEQAQRLATEDALLAAELARRAPSEASSLVRIVHARALLDAVRREVSQERPPSEAELEALAAARWWEFDRPRMVRVIHAVVRTQSENLEARAVAEQLRAAVLPLKSAAEFKRVAEALDAHGLSIRVEVLPPIAPDGRSVDPDRPPPEGPSERNMAPEFARAASLLQREGELSPVVRSPFGYHVIRLLSVVDELHVAPAERTQRLRDELVTELARQEKDELIVRLRAELKPDQERSAIEAIGKLGAEP